ncbi:branched-chain amino acid ABC transporter permease [Halanaerobium congolense]|jgi:branched-chain amino acid transport system permease protein|uniref:Amino acid/amide ABC transporter membrane protein 2 (HAAT family) n=1 Tax=Halanaerobium congolense TaxID=54121 RepID=A0A1M7GH78_9FIRM|nr:branched-chain amino acid ABC transporter permease [Halanaerobium congolense]PXV69415.1 amino acid/amide ABC transporter membrane protein 2 (HAAT family) [Halanaerobium congolense]SHM15643.1 amino acid/amide ABC transporter membrane protein 2, HAAT family [Halanaerobium congolense]
MKLTENHSDNFFKNRKKYTLVILFIFFILLFILSNSLSGYYYRILLLFGINVILTLSLNITNGYANIFSLGHGGLMLAGGYTTALLTLPVEFKANTLSLPLWLEQAQVPFIFSIILAGIVAMIVGLTILLPAFRLKGHYFILASLGINIIMINIAENVRPITNGATGLRGAPPYTNIWWIFGIAIFLIYLIWTLLTARFGRAIKAIGKDQGLAEAMGVNSAKYKAYAFMISSFFTGVGGALWTHLILTISPSSFDLLVVFQIIMMLVIGGISSISGSILGAAIITAILEILQPLQEGINLFGFEIPRMFGLTQVLLAVFLIIVMIYKPDGIMGEKEIKLLSTD